jgi:tetratricopeptide (TPR) repeat protein
VLDDTLTAGRLDKPTRAESPHHTIGDSEDDASRDEDAPKQLGVGDRFAGFQIRGFLGRGAMGVVYEAWDPTLERRVALKLLRSPSRRAAERLLREARALARLDHPGVVRIWAADVHRGAVYIAMELVGGQNLREWMKASRTWGEILPVMIGAGRGLAAAHAAGVIHRDFKPENVLVGWDGQARVLDFGIARVSTQHPDHFPASSEDPPEGEEALSGTLAGQQSGELGELTEVGTLIGTLLYMSPEQHARERADERSDQFSFCATLFEAIYGEHPFLGKARTAEQLAAQVSEGEVHFPNDDHSKAPRWLERVIVKGLSTAPDDRYETMEELIDALERHPARRRRRNRVLTVAAVAAAAVTLGVLVPRAEPADLCVDVGRELDGVLGEAAREKIAARFAALGAPRAVKIGERVDAALEDWSGRWVEARTQVCRARHAHRQATSLDRRREACLAAQLEQVGALGSVLKSVPSHALIKTEQALVALPDPALCFGDDPPQVQDRPEGTEALVEELHELVWLVMTSGGERETHQRAVQVVAEVRALPKSTEASALLAEALVTLANAQLLNGDLAQAEVSLREAVRTAERIGADGIRARAVVDLGWTLANIPGRTREAIAILEDAAALIERIGNPSFERERERQALGEALLAAGETERAQELFETTRAEFEELGHNYLPHFTTLMGLSRVALQAGEYSRALDHASEALELIEAKLGEDDPLVATVLTNVGLAQAGLGHDEAARAAYERSIALRRRQLEGESTPGNHVRLAEVLINLGNLHSAMGRAREAADAYREALALLPEDDDSNRALVLFNLGVDHQLAGRPEQALASYRQALRLAERVHPMDNPRVVGARLGVGSMLLALGRPAEARGPLERSLADWPASLRDSSDEGELRFGLARTSYALDGWSARVETLASEASAIYKRLGASETVAEIDAWIAENRPKP